MTTVEFDDRCYRRFIATVSALHPQKCFGYLLGAPGSPTVTDFYIFCGDLRGTEAGREMFEPVGRYYRDHGDAGFLAPPEETLVRLDRVRRAGLWWGATPVTVGRYQSVMRGIDVAAPAATLPVTQVDAHDAALFARLVGGRLPTLDEFRACAADGGSASQPELELADVAVFSENATRYPAPVASRMPGPHGMYDLQGLVWEWAENGSGWATFGGSRFAFAEMCAPEVAIQTNGDYRATDIGFRVCWDD